MSETAIRLHIEKLAGGPFLATSAEVPGLVAEGRSVAEATGIAQGLAPQIAESCIEHGDPLPPAGKSSHGVRLQRSRRSLARTSESSRAASWSQPSCDAIEARGTDGG